MDKTALSAPSEKAPGERTAAVEHSILIHFGELGLKVRNQPMFRRQLRRNIRLKLRSFGLDWAVADSVGVLTVQIPARDQDKSVEPVLEGLRQVFGIAWIASARRMRPVRIEPQKRARDLALVRQELIQLADAQFAHGKTFSVRVNRGNKLLPFASPDLARDFGQAIRDQTRWKSVDLENPDVTFHVDLRCVGSFLFGQKLKGPGGLPVGTAGRVLALLSGGIDSPVAAYLMAKRGCRVDFIHFSATGTSREEVLNSKVHRLARHLGKFTLGARLYVVPYTLFDLALMRQKTGYELVLFRRFMVRVAEQLARQIRARVLVTGDNLSQVASQTMTNLVATAEATRLQVFRPLLAFDKEETVGLAQQIGTYGISVEPYKDCCALISGQPKTRAYHERLEQIEARAFPDYDALVEKTLADVLCVELPVADQSDAHAEP